MMLLLVQSGDVSSEAIFTLLGVGITGFVTFSSLFVKHMLDMRVEKQRYLRQRESEQLEHKRNLDRMQIEAGERRSDARLRQQTGALAHFLAATVNVYIKIRTAQKESRGHQQKDRYLNDLHSIDPGQAQIAFEEVCIVSSAKIIERATKLWYHLRGEVFTTRFSNRSLGAWRGKYWKLRKELISAFQLELSGSSTSVSERVDLEQVKSVIIQDEQSTNQSNSTKASGA